MVGRAKNATLLLNVRDRINPPEKRNRISKLTIGTATMRTKHKINNKLFAVALCYFSEYLIASYATFTAYIHSMASG